MRARLGVNIDHVATVREARGTPYPDPLQFALLAEKAGADQITVHLREDRRHIKDDDVIRLKRTLQGPLNLEMAATDEMLRIALRIRPDTVTFVPEKRAERTTEGGLDLVSAPRRATKLLRMIESLRAKRIRVSAFIEANTDAVTRAAELGCDAVEFHTGRYCERYDRKKSVTRDLAAIQKAIHHARVLGLNPFAGHGLHEGNLPPLVALGEIEEYNIGHSIVALALECGMVEAVRRFKRAVNGRG